ncbi:mechanosensitive ion channel family protein [Natronospora cellulosivora (SeqCode)]
MEIEIVEILNWFKENLFTIYHLIQVSILIIIAIISYHVSGRFRNHLFIEKLLKFLKYIKIISKENIVKEINKLLWPIVAILIVWFYILLALNLNWPFQIVMIVGHILNAWVIIKIISSFIKNIFVSRFIAIIIWIIAVLKILEIYDSIIQVLDTIELSTGAYNISALNLINTLIIFSILAFLADKIASFLETRVNKIRTLTPSARVLFKKFIRIILMTIVGLIALSNLGIDLTAFAFLGGTLGVGLGFGLQKVVSNFVSGIIIILDKSVKPGDIIEINDTYGYINSLDTRFVSLVTRSGKEYLIPNEDFITQTVVNWSYSDKKVRIDVPIGISYESDPSKVIDLIEEAVKDINRINKDIPPRCLVEEFADSSIDLVLRFWISDPQNGVANVKSDVMLKIWDVLKENNISIPYPQRDLHLKTNTMHQEKIFDN